MMHRVLAILAGVALLAWGVQQAAGERTGGDVSLDSESLNTCGASFASAANAELGWTIGLYGLHSESSDDMGGSLELQSGVWTGSADGYIGTVFMFK